MRGDASRLPSFPDTRKDGTEGFNGSGSGGTQVAEGCREQGGAQRLRFGRERGAVERRPVAGVELAADGRVIRKLWVRAVQKVDERWIFKDLEVETTGTAHRTRLHFDKVSFPDQR